MRLNYIRFSLLGVAFVAALAALAVLASPTAAQALQPATQDEPRTAFQEDGEADIVGTAVEAGDFTTLLTAVEAAGLEDTLRGEGPFTVFAPTDDAFAALPEGTIEGLLEDTAALQDVLLYHVVEGEVLAEDVVGLSSAGTVQGSEIRIAVEDGSVRLNDDVTVVATDVMAANGVIHVIDGVLLPSDDSETPMMPAETGSAGIVAEDGGMTTGAWMLVGAGMVALAGFLVAVRQVRIG